jgi:Ca2+-binding RTX toxin-like protein
MDVGTGPSEIHAGAGDDDIVATEGSTEAYGDDGNDTIAGDEGNDRLFGGNGNDEIDGGPGSNDLSGDDGNDTFFTVEADDDISGGAGDDELNYSAKPVVVTQTGLADDGEQGSHDNVRPDVEAIVTGPGADRLTGGYAANRFVTNAGDDFVYVRGGGTDQVACGAGMDGVVADFSDKIESDCENVQRLSEPIGFKLKLERCKRAVANCIKVSCPASAKQTCAGVASVSARKRRVRKSASKKLAAGPVSLRAGATKEFRLRWSIRPKSRKAYRRAKVTAKAAVADGDGATSTVSASYKLKPKRK